MANEHHDWKDDESTEGDIIDLTFSLWNVTPVTVQVTAGGNWREDAASLLAMWMHDTMEQVDLEGDCYHAEVDGRRVLVREIDGCIQYREPDDAPSVVGPKA